jgi:hypothetical protein
MEFGYARLRDSIRYDRLTDIDLASVIENVQSYFIASCIGGDKDVAEWLYCLSKVSGNRVLINENDDYPFRVSCQSGYRDVAEWLYSTSKVDNNVKVDINACNSYAFVYSCKNGHQDVVQWLYCLSKSDGNTEININIDNEYPFRLSCAYGHKSVAEWLYSTSKNQKGIDITACNDYAFAASCIWGYTEIAEWLCMLDSRYKIEYSHGVMMPQIRSIKTILLENDTRSISELISKSKHPNKSCGDCMICLSDDSQIWVKIDCGHEVCSDCFVHIDRCPLKCNDGFNMNNVSIMHNNPML